MAKPASKEWKSGGMREKQWPYHLMLLPAVILVLIFKYLPIGGLVMVFQKYNPFKGFLGSKWVGLDNFKYVFSLPDFGQVLFNTVFIAFFKMALGIIVPLILALLINEIRIRWIARTVQTAAFLPYFLSWVILASVVSEVLYLNGPINQLIQAFGGEPVMFLADNKAFPWVLIISDVWKGMGYNMVVYLAAITSVDVSMYEAADIDGASIFQKMFLITLPNIMPMVVLLATLNLGNILSAGFDQVFMLYSPVVYESGDILDTLVYRIGMVDMQYSIGATIDFFKGIVSFLLVIASYTFAYKKLDYRLF